MILPIAHQLILYMAELASLAIRKIILWNEMSRMSLKLCWIVDFYYLYPDAIAMGMVRIYARFLD